MIIDRIPHRFYEGPFWGNGKMGAVLYIKDGKLHFSLDHVKLWEMRESLKDEPAVTFQEFCRHKTEYVNGDPAYVMSAGRFENYIGRTRLPGLSVEVDLPGKVTEFEAVTDLEKAETQLNLELEGGKRTVCRVRLDSFVNILYLEICMEGANPELLEVNARGWNLEEPEFSTLKEWNYEPCRQTGDRSQLTMIQHYSDHNCAVICARQQKKAGYLSLAVGIQAGEQEKEEEIIREGGRLTEDYLRNAEHYREAHEKDWAAFWSRFDIRIPNERLQEAFWQEMYKLYCNEREESMPITLQGIWNADDRMPVWCGDLHNDLNVQSCYWPAYKTGNINLARPYIEYYSAAAPRFRERALKLFGIPNAIHIPTMMAPDGRAAAAEWRFWNTVLGPELFVAVDFVWFYEYSREQDTLRDKIYPFVEQVLNLYRGIAIEKEDGYLHIPFTISPEVVHNGTIMVEDDSTFTLSCLHYLCRKMAEYAIVLKEDGSRFLEWEVRLAPVQAGETGYPVFAGVNLFESHRHFCHLFPIFPLCEQAHNQVAQNSLNAVINQGFLEYAAFSFPYAGIFAARCGRGNMCRTMLEMYCMAFRAPNSFTVNGDPYGNGLLRVSDTSAGESADAFTLESGFFVPTLLCEMFVHRAKNDVWLLMGIPDEWKDCSCRGLTIEGGHSICITMEKYQIREVVLQAGCDEELFLHWKEKAVPAKVLRDGQETVWPVDSGRIEVKKGQEWRLKFSERKTGLS